MITISIRTAASVLLLFFACSGCGSERPSAAPATLVVSSGSATGSEPPAGTVVAVDCPLLPVSTTTPTVAPSTEPSATMPVSSGAQSSSSTPTTPAPTVVAPVSAPVVTTNQPVTVSTPTATAPQATVVAAPVSEPVTTGNPNIALTAQVILEGGALFTNGWGQGKTVDAGTIIDGLFVPRNTQWDQGPVWWDSRDGIERSLLIELDGKYTIDSFIVQADDNDAYVLSYRDPITGVWKTAWSIPNYDVVPSEANWGMQTRPAPGNDRARYVLPAPIVTDALRIAGDMNDGDRYFSVSEVQAFGIAVPSAPPPSPTPAPGATTCPWPFVRIGKWQAGYGTAVIDGVMNAAEWATAARIDYQANLPPNDGGGTTPASLYVMNDGTNLYFALKIARSSVGGATNPSFGFDNNDDGCPADGDDGFGMSVGIYSSVNFTDIYRYSCPGAEANTGGCSAYDGEWSRGVQPPGASEGMAAAKNDGSFTVIELSHPLNSGDPLHDIALRPGDSVGFHHSLRLFSLAPSCNYGWNCMADTEVPVGGGYNVYGRITTAVR